MSTSNTTPLTERMVTIAEAVHEAVREIWLAYLERMPIEKMGRA